MSVHRIFRLGVVLALSAWLPACQHFERVGECSQVAKLVNPVLAAVDAERQKEPATSRTYRFIALQYGSLAGSISSLHLHTKHLGDLLGEYQKVLRSAEHDARTFADALDAKDAIKIAAIRGAASRNVRQESGTLTRLDGFCRGH